MVLFPIRLLYIVIEMFSNNISQNYESIQKILIMQNTIYKNIYKI